MLVMFFRALILYALVVTGIRIMGKRQVGELQPFELVVTIMIAELASVPMENTGTPLLNGIVPILALLLAEVFISYITLKSERARTIVCGSPSIVIQNGKIVQRELARLRYNVNDLLEQLREKNIVNVSDVEFAILETNGQLSVIPKPQKRPVTAEDLNLSTRYEGLPYTLIMDGHIQHKNLAKAGVDINWLLQQLEIRGLKPKDVFFAYLDSQRNLQIEEKEKRR
ncbi:MAG: DUF421 domain-containing protein [Caldicoprobacter sp.]|uniref:DUF421 domain-containing protein n=1 Tax=Caldicoprobacter sp. TaxID=2004500 RepID=UPI001D66DB74|nr:hypothetical protein [Clostridia bacterium]